MAKPQMATRGRGFDDWADKLTERKNPAATSPKKTILFMMMSRLQNFPRSIIGLIQKQKQAGRPNIRKFSISSAVLFHFRPENQGGIFCIN